jgi:hypothetical protein
MSAYYAKVSDPVVKEQYEQIIAAGGRVAGPAAEALLTSRLDQDTVEWLKTNYLKTELEAGSPARPGVPRPAATSRPEGGHAAHLHRPPVSRRPPAPSTCHPRILPAATPACVTSSPATWRAG